VCAVRGHVHTGLGVRTRITTMRGTRPHRPPCRPARLRAESVRQDDLALASAALGRHGPALPPWHGSGAQLGVESKAGIVTSGRCGASVSQPR
jgi:hypothetical protein